ncbi:MAG: DUF1566 domain-containing protein [Campylobacterota bacterium]|nr:DUF1566 domain-containing protein [Campylobacterota bacterium]
MLKIMIGAMMLAVLVMADLPLGKTGQSVEYLAGDDGSYISGRTRAYSDNGNGTINDAMLNLMWQNDYSDNKGFATDGNVPDVNHADATSYCTAIDLAGHTDWRLPTRRELQSLVDYSKPYPGPVMADAFVATTQTDDWYWTGTDYAAGTTGALPVHFSYGDVYADHKSNTYYVRCVRGSVAPLNPPPTAVPLSPFAKAMMMLLFVLEASLFMRRKVVA